MGLDSRKASASRTDTSAAISLTLAQEVPEKEPWAQLCRFTMLASSAKVMAKSVTAEQI